MTSPNPTCRPPRLAARLFRRLYPDGGLDTTMGDLEEIFSALAAEAGPRQARRWYWHQLLKGLPYRLIGFIFLDIPMFALSLKIMGRGLRKHKSFSTLTVIALALGLTCFLMSYLYVRYESTYDSFHEDSGRLYKVVLGITPGAEKSRVPRVDVGSAISQVPEVERSAETCWAFNPVAIRNGQKRETRGLFADESFLRMFNFPVRRGGAPAMAKPFTVFLTEEAGLDLFGREDPLGQTLEFIIRDERCEVTVAGIMADLPRHTSFAFDLLLSLPTTQALPGFKGLLEAAPHLVRTYVKVRPGSSAAGGAEKMAALFNRTNPAKDPDSRISCSLQPVSDIHLRPNPDDSRAVRAIYLYLSLGVLVLIIAVVNYINLSVACSSVRMREIGIRKTFGAARRQLVRQFVAEAVVLTIVSFLLSLVVMMLVLPAFNHLMGTGISLLMLGRGTFGLKVSAIVLLIGAAAGLYPALVLSSPQPVRVLKTAPGPWQGKGSRPSRLRNVLVVAQFSAALVLTVITLFIHGQLRFIREKDMGFDKSRIVEAWAFPPLGTVVKSKLLQDPRVLGVTLASNAVSLSNRNLPEATWGDPVQARDDSGGSIEFRAHRLYCDADFVRVFNIGLAAGRNFSKDEGDAGSIIVNETFARRLGPGSPLGKRVRVDGREATIIGLVEDFHVQPFTQAIRPVILSYTDQNFVLLYARMRGADARESLGIVRQALDEVYPDDVPDVTLLEDRLINIYQAEKRQAALLSIFSVLAVVIAGLGVFGLAAFAAERRTKEIGIRKVLGADTARLYRLMSADFCRLSLIAAFIGWPLALCLVQLWLRNFAYHVPIQPWTFLLAGLGMLGLMLLTAGTQIYKIARVDPVKTLKYE